jgi:hypothetical protein
MSILLKKLQFWLGTVLIPIIPVMLKLELGRTMVQGQPGQKVSKTLVQPMPECGGCGCHPSYMGQKKEDHSPGCPGHEERIGLKTNQWGLERGSSGRAPV